MSVNLGTEQNPLIAFVAVSGGYVDAVVRATDLAAFEAAAKVAELLYQDDSGEWVAAKGVNIDHIGPVEITPGTYDAEGNEITAPVMDNRHHVNVRLGPPATERVDAQGALKWHKWALAWTQTGADDTQVNASEQAKVLMDVALIDPDSITSPSRVFL